MKITAVKAIGLRWECPVMSDAMSVCKARQALWVKVETDSGIYGIGEAFCYGSPLIIARPKLLLLIYYFPYQTTLQ